MLTDEPSKGQPAPLAVGEAKGRPRSKNTGRTLVAAMILTPHLALVCNLTIEVAQAGNVNFVLATTLDERLPLFMLGSFVIWVFVILLLAITGRLWLTIGLMGAATVLVSFANHQKMTLRQEPLYPSDMSFATETGFLREMVGVDVILLLVLTLGLIATISVLAGRMLSRVFPSAHAQNSPRLLRSLRVIRVLGAAVALAALAYIGQFNTTGNLFRAAYEQSGAHWKWHYQKLNYGLNGFVGGMLYNLNAEVMKRPHGYSRATMERLATKYGSAAKETNESRPGSLQGVNVVMVLSEAFTDPTQIRGVEFAEDPIPFTRQLMARNPSGAMLAQAFGGGTANMEFEALTGQSLMQFEPQVNSPYQQFLPDQREYPSLVGYFKSLGHQTLAVHPYMPTMYQRERVYDVLGFDRFIHEDGMASTRTIDDSEFIADSSAFGEVTRQIANSEVPLFVNLVTMQNHYPMADKYVDPIEVSGIANADEDANASGYARGLRHTDDALKGFLQRLRQSEEKTIVVFYGDHQPAFWSREAQKRNSERALRETVFFVWSNLAASGANTSPTTSPFHFGNNIFEEAHAPVPPLYELLRQLEEEIPAMERGLMIGSANEQLTSSRDLTPRARRLLNDYRLVQYDLSVGHGYAKEAMFY